MVFLLNPKCYFIYNCIPSTFKGWAKDTCGSRMAKSVEAKDDREDNLFKKYARSMPVREATSNNKLTLTARSLELIYTKENWPPGIESGDDFPAGSGSLKARGM